MDSWRVEKSNVYICMMKKETKIILATESRAKRKLLKDFGVVFTAVASGYEEPDPMGKEKPVEYVKRMALEKARRVREKVGKKDALIIALDNVGVLKKKILGKPHSEFVAKKFLRELSGNTVVALTGVAVVDALSGKEVTDVVETEVVFRKMSLREIDAYVATGEPLNAAAGFKIQSGAAMFVKEIKGDFFSVVGVPIFRIAEILRDEFNYSLAEYVNAKN